jgi:hypothetical protein
MYSESATSSPICDGRAKLGALSPTLTATKYHCLFIDEKP